MELLVLPELRQDEDIKHLLEQYRSAEVGYFGFREMARANPRFNTPMHRSYRVHKALEFRKLRELLKSKGIPLPQIPSSRPPARVIVNCKDGSVLIHRQPYSMAAQ